MLCCVHAFAFNMFKDWGRCTGRLQTAFFKPVSQSMTCLSLSEFDSTRKSQTALLACMFYLKLDFFLNFLFVLKTHVRALKMSDKIKVFFKAMILCKLGRGFQIAKVL